MADGIELLRSMMDEQRYKQPAIDLWRAYGDAQWLSITGHSMLPLLRAGDQVQVAATSSYVLGDLVLFQQSGQLIVHRIVAHSGQVTAVDESPTWICQGDNCTMADPPITPSQILGKVVTLRRGDAIQRIDSWWWRLGNQLVVQCTHLRRAHPAKRLMLRLLSRYLRLLLKR
jgi:signal peptidase I